MGRLGVPIPALYAGIRPPPPSTATFGCSELRPDASVAVAGSGNVRKRAMSEMFHFAVPALQLLDAPAAAAPPACCAACASACAGCASSAGGGPFRLPPPPSAAAAPAAASSPQRGVRFTRPELARLATGPVSTTEERLLFVELHGRLRPASAADFDAMATAFNERVLSAAVAAKPLGLPTNLFLKTGPLLASFAAVVTDAQAQAMALSPSPDAGAAAAALQSANVAGNTSVPSLPPVVPRPPPAFVALPTRQQPAVAAAGEPAAAALSGRTAGCCGYAQKGHKTKGAPCINLSNEKPGWVGSAEHKKYLKRKETEKKDAKK